MKIKFTGKYIVNSYTGGIDFYTIADGKDITCKVTEEALQDICPKNRFDNVKKQFLSNQSKLKKIAKEKILNGDIHIDLPLRCVFITSSDVCPSVSDENYLHFLALHEFNKK